MGLDFDFQLSKIGIKQFYSLLVRLVILLFSALMTIVECAKIKNIKEEIKSFSILMTFKAKSRKYRGIFEVKSLVKTCQVRGIWSQQLEPCKSPNGGRNHVSGRVSVPCWHAIPVANTSWKIITHNSGKVKFGIKVMKLVESLIGLEVLLQIFVRCVSLIIGPVLWKDCLNIYCAVTYMTKISLTVISKNQLT